MRITNGFIGDTLSADPGTTGIIASYSLGTFTLTLSGTATLDQYRQVLDTVTYSSSASDPTSGGDHATRSIQWQLGDGNVEQGQSEVQQTILFYAPILDLDQSGAGTGFSGTFAENGAGVPIADTDVFIFTSNEGIESALITLTNAHPGDTLIYDNSSPNITAITDTSNPNQIVLILSGSQDAAGYQTALHHVTYSNTSDNPDTTARQITVVVNDLAAASNIALDTISVIAVNDPPTAQSATVSTHQNHAVSGTAVATDPDNTPDQLG